MKATLEGWMRRGQKRKERALQSSTVGRGAHRSPEGLTDHQRVSLQLTALEHPSAEPQYQSLLVYGLGHIYLIFPRTPLGCWEILLC